MKEIELSSKDEEKDSFISNDTDTTRDTEKEKKKINYL